MSNPTPTEEAARGVCSTRSSRFYFSMKADMTAEEFRNRTKPHKYGARPCVVDGIKFQSRKEADRYAELKLLERADKVRDVRCQVRMPIEVNCIHIADYICDFVYWDMDKRCRVWEDVKGFRTDVYRLKKKLVEALFGISILET